MVPPCGTAQAPSQRGCPGRSDSSHGAARAPVNNVEAVFDDLALEVT